MKTVSIEAPVVSHKRMAASVYEIVLRAPAIAAKAVPGQFVMVKVASGTDPLLRRPLSIHAVTSGQLTIVYDVVGPATTLLAQRRSGETVSLLGPLGNGFDLTARPRGYQPLLIAGGIGVAPLGFLARALVRRGSVKPLVLIGARTGGQIVCAEEFRRLGCAVHLSTDDGSCGVACRVTELLERMLDGKVAVRQFRRTADQAVRIYACGPKPMLRQVSRIAGQRQIPAQLSLEAHMACGIGACLGCTVATIAGFKRVCKEGPVFEAQEIVW